MFCVCFQVGGRLLLTTKGHGVGKLLGKVMDCQKLRCEILSVRLKLGQEDLGHSDGDGDAEGLHRRGVSVLAE